MATDKVQLKKVKFTDNLSAQKRVMYRSAIKYGSVISKEKMVDNLVKENYIPQVYASGVLDVIGKTIMDYMAVGHSVQIPGLGTAKLVVSATANEDPKKCSAKDIKSVKLAIVPNDDIKAMLKRIGFVMTDSVDEGSDHEDEGDVPTGNEEEEEQTLPPGI